MISKDNIIILKDIFKNTVDKYHFCIHQVFDVTVDSNWRIIPRKINDWMIVYARNGEGFYNINGEKEEIKEGKIFFISHNLLHSSWLENNNCPNVIAIRFGIYNNISNEIICNHFKPFGFAIQPDKLYEFKDLFETISRYFLGFPANISKSVCNTALIEIFQLLTLQILGQNISKKGRLEEARKYIDNNISSPPTLIEISQKAGLSSKYFSRLFHKYYGITVKKYIMKVRMEKAKFLLSETCLSIKEISNILGYSDQYIFSNQFKSYYNLSPTKYRKMLENQISLLL